MEVWHSVINAKKESHWKMQGPDTTEDSYMVATPDCGESVKGDALSLTAGSAELTLCQRGARLRGLIEVSSCHEGFNKNAMT